MLEDFNSQKTKALIISNTAYIDNVIKFNDEQVEIVECHKHLGVTFSSGGKWTNHINNIIESSMKQINALRKLKYILSSKSMSNIYLTFIRLLLEYACEDWDGCCEREIERLEKVQLEAARIVTGLTKFASRESLCFETVWETLTERRKNRKLCIFYKMHNDICPQYLSDCLPSLVSNVSGYNLRNNDNYLTIRPRLNVYAISFVASTISLWNNLSGVHQH